MRLTRTTAIVLLLGMLTLSFRPKDAQALDLASSTVATVGGVVAIVGAVMMGKEESEDTGRTMLITGLSISAASSAMAVLLNLIVLAAQDRVLQLEYEADAGNGPLIDALSSAFGVSRQEVVESIRRQESKPAPGSAIEHPRVFTERLLSDLASRARLTKTAATRILYDLHTERAQPGTAVSRHELLAEIIGVPVEVISPVVALHLDRALEQGATPGEVVSARTIIAANAQSILDGLVDDLATRHQKDLFARALAARAESHSYRALNAAQ